MQESVRLGDRTCIADRGHRNDGEQPPRQCWRRPTASVVDVCAGTGEAKGTGAAAADAGIGVLPSLQGRCAPARTVGPEEGTQESPFDGLAVSGLRGRMAVARDFAGRCGELPGLRTRLRPARRKPACQGHLRMFLRQSRQDNRKHPTAAAEPETPGSSICHSSLPRAPQVHS